MAMGGTKFTLPDQDVGGCVRTMVRRKEDIEEERKIEREREREQKRNVRTWRDETWTTISSGSVIQLVIGVATSGDVGKSKHEVLVRKSRQNILERKENA